MSNRTASVHLVLLDGEPVDLREEVALQDSGRVRVTDVLNCFDGVTLEKAYLLKDDGNDNRGVFIGAEASSSMAFSPSSANRLRGKLVPTSSAAANPPAVQQKVFACVEAAHPSLHFYIQPKQADKLLQGLNDLRWHVMCSGRQTGKSTICAAFETELRRQGFVVVSIMLGGDIPVDNVEDFWGYMHRLLHTNNKARFPDETPERPSSATFMQLFDREKPGVWVLIDEASQLASLQDHVLDDFLTITRGMRNRMGQHSLEGMPLFGVYSIVRLLHGRNRRREHAPPSSAVAAATTEAAAGHVPPSTAGGPVGGRNYGPMVTVNASSFKVADLADAGHFSQEDIQSLLEQYVTQQQQINPGSICLQQQDLPYIAQSLYKLTSGHKGLVGTCCHLLHEHSITTAEQWQKFSAVSLARRVGMHGSFAHILTALRFVYPTVGMSACDTPPRQDRRKAQQEAMCDVVFKGSHVVRQEKLPLLQEVLDEGILVPQNADEEASAFLLLDKVTLTMPCPLMVSCILQRMFITRCKQWNHGVGGLNLVGDLLVQVVHNVNPQVPSMRQTSNAAGSTSEYALQAETYMLAVGIMQKRTEGYIVLPIARQHDIKKSAPFRVDFVVTSKRSGVPLEPFGMELLSAGDTVQIDDHVKRAGISHRCTVSYMQ